MRNYYIKAPENKKAFFYPNEWNRFYELLSEKQKINFKFMIQTGARINEIRNIKVSDIDDERGIRLRITKCKAIKGEKYPVPRPISISTDFLNFLKKYIRLHNLKQDDTFRIMSTNQLNIIIKNISKIINKREWKDLSCHNIRKTFISWCYSLDIDPVKLSLHVGHDIKTALKHYASPDIFNREDKNSMRKILGDLFIK